jgi:hypothetical protein
MRLLRPLLLVAALLFSQHAAMLHGLTHAQHDLALATLPEGKAPALDHGSDVCAAFGALAHALGNAAAPLSTGCAQGDVLSGSFTSAPVVPRIVFDSRAPPLSA